MVAHGARRKSGGRSLAMTETGIELSFDSSSAMRNLSSAILSCWTKIRMIVQIKPSPKTNSESVGYLWFTETLRFAMAQRPCDGPAGAARRERVAGWSASGSSFDDRRVSAALKRSSISETYFVCPSCSYERLLIWPSM